MIVESIQLKNFQCYSGDLSQNTFKFGRGLNLIIGENGSGKSKLWDAFFWVLNDKIFQSDDRKFTTTGDYEDKLISDKAKSEASIGDQVDTQVVLVAKNSQGLLYRVTRMYRVEKASENTWSTPDTSTLLIEEKKSTKWNVVAPDKHQVIIDTIIKPQLKPYMWFQGEHINDLMDLGDKQALTEVIRLLSDIETYNSIEKVAQRGAAQSDSALSKEQAKSAKDAGRAESLEKELRDARKSLEQDQKSLDSEKATYAAAKQRKEELMAKAADAGERQRVLGELDALTRQIDDAGERLDKEIESFSKNLISRSWVLKNAPSALSQFEEKFADFSQRYYAHKRKFQPELIDLPIDVPAPVHVKSMLEAEKCLVCGREAKKGTDEHSHIASLLERVEDEEAHIFDIDNFNFFQRLYNNVIENKGIVKNLDADISASLNAIHEGQQRIKQLREDHAASKNQIPGILEGDTEQPGRVVREFQTHDRRAEEAQDNIRRFEDLIGRRTEHIQNKEKELTSLAGAKVSSVLETQRDVWRDVLQIASEARNDVFLKIVRDLESRSNKIFQQMAEGTNAITGKVRLDVTSSNTCVPRIVDAEGEALSGSNDSNIILVKLALIMSVLRSREAWSKNYALIADAPTSKMARNYADGFYRALSENFEQSIVVTYDFLNDEERQRLDGLHIGSIHKITSSHRGDNRESRHDLKVAIEAVGLK